MLASGYYVRPRIDLWRCLLPISIVNEGSRARGVVGPLQGPGRCTRRGQGQETGRHDLSTDLSSDNTGDCHRKEVLVQVGTNKQALASAELSPSNSGLSCHLCYVKRHSSVSAVTCDNEQWLSNVSTQQIVSLPTIWMMVPLVSGQKRVGGWITLTADVFLRPSPSITPGVRWPR